MEIKSIQLLTLPVYRYPILLTTQKMEEAKDKIPLILFMEGIEGSRSTNDIVKCNTFPFTRCRGS
jgi:hypothetical protein